MNHLPLIIKREYINKVRNKSFIIMTFLSPMVMIGLVVVVAYLSQINNNEDRTITVLDETGLFNGVFKNFEHISYDYVSGKSLSETKNLVLDKEQYGLLYIKKSEDSTKIFDSSKFFSEESPSLTVISNLESKIEKKLTDLKLLEDGVDIQKIEASRTVITIAQESFEGQKTSKMESYLKLAFGGAAGYLLFMFIIIYGNMTMRSVIEEKTSRIIEIIISSVKPVQLMMGKIIGTTLAAITQFLIWIILGAVMLFVISYIFNIDLGQIQSPQKAMLEQAITSSDIQNQAQELALAFFNLPILNLCIAFLFFFLGGFLLYSSFYAAIGAAVDSETDTQQFMMPIIMPLILAVYVGFFTVIEDPHGTVSTIFSFIPLTSPVVMLMRIPFGVPIWQQALSLFILIATFVFTVWFAAKIYRVGILMYGKKPSYKELFKWLRY